MTSVDGTRIQSSAKAMNSVGVFMELGIHQVHAGESRSKARCNGQARNQPKGNHKERDDLSGCFSLFCPGCKVFHVPVMFPVLLRRIPLGPAVEHPSVNAVFRKSPSNDSQNERDTGSQSDHHFSSVFCVG